MRCNRCGYPLDDPRDARGVHFDTVACFRNLKLNLAAAETRAEVTKAELKELNDLFHAVSLELTIVGNWSRRLLLAINGEPYNSDTVPFLAEKLRAHVGYSQGPGHEEIKNRWWSELSTAEARAAEAVAASLANAATITHAGRLLEVDPTLSVEEYRQAVIAAIEALRDERNVLAHRGAALESPQPPTN